MHNPRTQRLRHDKGDLVVEASLAEFLPEAAQLVRQEFCSDCPRRHGCNRFCLSAQVMTKVYLGALVKQKASLN